LHNQCSAIEAKTKQLDNTSKMAGTTGLPETQVTETC